MTFCARFSYTELCVACSNQTQTARASRKADSSPCKDEDLTRCFFQCWSSAVGGGPILKQRLSAPGPSLCVRISTSRRQILTHEDGPRTERSKIFITVIDP